MSSFDQLANDQPSDPLGTTPFGTTSGEGITERVAEEDPGDGDLPQSSVPRPPLARALLKEARPKQWIKNVLVLAAPAAAGELANGGTLAKSGLAFLAFCLASISTYYVNDALDHKSDRMHPKKRLRPIAAGWISLPLAWSVASMCLVISLALSFGALGSSFGLLTCGYVAMTLSYSFWLKHVAVVDLACVTSGFVLRMIAGGIATNITLSNWFLTVACFSSLFIVAGKRYAEMVELGDNAGSRAVLREYTAGFLRMVWSMALAVSVAAYCQWAFERADMANVHVWYQLSAIPWVIALLRYALLIERGQGGAPEEIFVSDRVLQILGVLWVAFFIAGVYDF